MHLSVNTFELRVTFVNFTKLTRSSKVTPTRWINNTNSSTACKPADMVIFIITITNITVSQNTHFLVKIIIISDKSMAIL
jgi:hypothetical protein